ncbi:MAG: DUF4430 domain-containing protein [bacterium]|nr:DUF4430 domain-containing protein [bacterium]
MNKGTLFLLFFVVLLGAGVSVGALLEGRTENIVLSLESVQAVKEDMIPITLVVKEVSHEMRVAKESNVYDVMVQAQEDSILSFKDSEFSSIGFLIEEINGLHQNSRTGEYWIYYINGKMAKIGVSAYTLQKNDVISWRYKKEYE